MDLDVVKDKSILVIESDLDSRIQIKAVFDSSEKDYGELIDIEIILDQSEPGPDDIPIFEKLYYSFEIEK